MGSAEVRTSPLGLHPALNLRVDGVDGLHLDVRSRRNPDYRLYIRMPPVVTLAGLLGEWPAPGQDEYMLCSFKRLGVLKEFYLPESLANDAN